MLHVIIDPRDNMQSMSSCNVCCCEPVHMRPGETNLMVLNYAPWSIPLAQGGPGVVPATQISIVADDSTCSTAEIGGFGPPTNQAYEFVVLLNAATPIDLAAAENPAGNSPFEYRIVPMTGPYHGTVDASDITGAAWVYTPAAGYVGWDIFYYEMKDAQGRKIIYPVALKVGTPVGIMPAGMNAEGLYIDPVKIKVDSTMQLVFISLHLAPDARECEVFRVTVKQPARSCDDVFYHITCFEVHVGKC